MKVLALHGYTQNSKNFLDRLKNFFPVSLRSSVTWMSPDGPYIIDKDMLGWWHLESKEMFIHPHEYIQVEIAMEQIPKGHYDMVVGFSQGAVAAMIALDRGRITTSKLILISPSDIMDPRYTPKENSTPVIIVTGQKDLLCPPEISKSVQKYYPNNEIHIHNGAHIVPNMKHLFEEAKIKVVK